MSDQSVLKASRHNTLAASSRKLPLSYCVTVGDDGTWLHPVEKLFIFAYLPNSASAEEKQIIGSAFETALQVPNDIKDQIKKLGGESYLGMDYFLDPSLVTKALNNVTGMSEIGGSSGGDSGTKVTVQIMDDFFQSVLSSLGGDVTVMQTWLQTQMQGFQVQIGKESNYNYFGTIVGTVSLVEGLDIPVTNFQYVYSDYATSQWVAKSSCSSQTKQSFSYSYDVTNFLYELPQNR
ncbi:hypothetical protein DIE19_31560 [Burkholderia sp. Bp9126]|nr:hypothetical protein DIE19_31560 [Burkholderia sp. Bp9126]